MSAHDANRESWLALGRWSRDPRMNDLEAVMWRAERHPQLSSMIMAVEILDSVPDWERLRDAHAYGAELVPRFRQRVVDPLLPVTAPGWELDPSFDLDYHLRRAALPAPGNEAALWTFAQTLAMAPLDRSRPLWEATLVEGLEGGRAAYILKSHHSLSDGIAGIQLFGGMHSRVREPTPGKPSPRTPVRRPGNSLAVLGDEVSGVARSLPGFARRLIRPAARALAAPDRVISETLELAGSARRVAGSGGPSSPLLEPRTGGTWRFAAVECALADLKAAAKAAGGSLNDAYLAALMGGLDRYHRAHDRPVDTLPLAMPVSLRDADDPQGGNRFTAAVIAGPVAAPGPEERMAIIRGAVLAARAEPALDVAGLAAPVLSRVPGIVALLARSAVGAAADVSASNIPGIRGEAYMAGARVERMYAFGPLPGAALMATLVSHDGTCCISLNIDGTAVPDPDRLRDCIAEALDEVLALAPADVAHA